jgi:hypothetical protein
MADSLDNGSTATLDLDAAVDRISASLGDIGGKLEAPTETPGLQTEPVQDTQPSATPEPPKTYEVPKSWKREMHDHWGKIDPNAQSYIIEREKQLLDGFQSFRPVQDALNPHLDFLRQLNITPHHAVDALLRAHRRLTEGTIEQRRTAYQELGKNLQLLEQAAASQDPAQPIDPNVQVLQQKLSTIEQGLEAERNARIEAIRQENMKLVNAFAADTKAHPYFEEVAEDMQLFIRQGLSLQEAYDKAVRVNDAVFQKEQARVLTEHEAKLKENARLAALPKKKAASVNLSSNGDGPEPTEPLGTIEDTIKREHKKIRERA